MTDPIPLKPMDVAVRTSGLGPAAMPNWAPIVGVVLGSLGAVPGGLALTGVGVPPWLSILGSVLSAIAAAFGAASPGIRK